MNNIAIASIVSLALFLLLIILLWKHIHEMLDDQTTNTPIPPYSLARTLLFYWTVIIVASTCWIGIKTGALPEITPNLLLLMGIVAGTTTSARIIDYSQINQGFARHQDEGKQSFLMDILSDDTGLSIHRFQLVLFNIIYGCAFLGTVISEHTFLNFDYTTLALLGISSGTYTLLKIPENTAATPNTTVSANAAQPAINAAPVPGMAAPLQADPAPAMPVNG